MSFIPLPLRSALCLLCSLLIMGGCGFRRAVPDETKVQEFPAWEPAPTDDLPIPQ